MVGRSSKYLDFQYMQNFYYYRCAIVTVTHNTFEQSFEAQLWENMVSEKLQL